MTPFTVADLTVFQTGIDTLPNYLSTPYIILLVGAILLVLAGLVFLFWKGPRSTASGRRRLMTGTAALAVFERPVSRELDPGLSSGAALPCVLQPGLCL